MTVTNACAVRRPTRGCRCFVAALFMLALSGAAGAQGISPGDLPKDGYKLPGGIEPVVQLRTYYFESESTSGKETEAWALGGWLGLRTPWYGDVFQAGPTTTSPASSTARKARAAPACSPPIRTRSTCWARPLARSVSPARRSLRTGSSSTGRSSANDSRMIPNTFEAYTLSGKQDDVAYTGGYITR